MRFDSHFPRASLCSAIDVARRGRDEARRVLPDGGATGTGGTLAGDYIVRVGVRRTVASVRGRPARQRNAMREVG
jgi:hypothetical protein